MSPLATGAYVQRGTGRPGTNMTSIGRASPARIASPSTFASLSSLSSERAGRERREDAVAPEALGGRQARQRLRVAGRAVRGRRLADPAAGGVAPAAPHADDPLGPARCRARLPVGGAAVGRAMIRLVAEEGGRAQRDALGALRFARARRVDPGLRDDLAYALRPAAVARGRALRAVARKEGRAARFSGVGDVDASVGVPGDQRRRTDVRARGPR